ncbi:MAG: hypothetical protein AAF696_07920 [Bacteroidota bacterium]
MEVLPIIFNLLMIGAMFASLLFFLYMLYLANRKGYEARQRLKYDDFLKRYEGKNFFCYNNRRKSLSFIREEILPQLGEDVHVLYLEGKEIRSEDIDHFFIYRSFYSFRHYSRFPHLLKIRNGKAEDLSVNQELFQCLDQGKDLSVIFNKMHTFFKA